MKFEWRRVRNWNWLLVAIIVLGLMLRLWAIDFGLPYTVAADEPTLMSASLRMIRTGNLEPRSLGYPHLSFYLLAIAFLSYFLVGRAFGIFATPLNIPFPEIVTVGVGKLEMPSEFLLARGVSILFGTATIFVVYKIGTRLYPNRSVATIAALLFAVCPINVYNSHLIRPDVYAMFFLCLAFFWIAGAYAAPNQRNYLLAGIGVGLAASAKYNAGVIAIALVAAHASNFGWRGFWRREIFAAGIAAFLAFIATTPYALLDFAALAPGLQKAVESQSVQDAQAGGSFLWYANYLWQSEGLVAALALFQIARFVARRDRGGWLLISFPLVYFIFISLFPVHNDRTLMHVMPFAALLAAELMVDAYDYFAPQSSPRLANLGLVFTIALVAIVPFTKAIQSDRDLLDTRSRDAARVWIESNLPTGARIAQEAYTPYVDTRRFVVQGVPGMADHSLEWYAQNGFEYLVFSKELYGRFFDEPQRYAEWVARYNQFFTELHQVKRFDDPRYEIRIYKTGVVLPQNRSAVRFGNDGDLLELVGYEPVDAVWIAPEPLRLRMYWRVLRDASESFQVSLQLFGAHDRRVGATRGDLLSDASTAPIGIIVSDWVIPVDNDAELGAYRVEVSVTQTRYDYQLPIETWYGESLGQLFLGPFDLAKR